MSTAAPIKVLICDDSALVRKMLRRTLESDPELVVVGEATNPYEAKDLIPKTRPDVLTLDIEMPRMDGLTFLRVLMKKWPMPVVVFSTLSTSGSQIAYKALELGAMEVLGKPQSGSRQFFQLQAKITQIVKTLGRVGIRTNAQRRLASGGSTAPALTAQSTWPAPRPGQLVLLGASTGGTEAIRSIMPHLPANFPPMCIVQHIPPVFSRTFAQHLNEITPLNVREATHGDRCEPGTVLVAPGDYHMVVLRDTRGYYVSLNQAEPVWHQRPAVEILFRSALKLEPSKTIAGLLTGMGSDGGQGLKALRDAGARTFGQSEETCVVYGMPRVAEKLGACEKMVDLLQVPLYLQRLLAQPASVPA
ncbi:MAG: chemotaxis response regulator protein-glutamate methylesterase [Opitutales bacterium]